MVAMFLPRDTHDQGRLCRNVRRRRATTRTKGPGREMLLAEIENMGQCVGANRGGQRAALLQ